MPKYVIERDIPGAGKLTPAELHGISERSCTTRIYCVYIAPTADLLREHARQGGFPANRISEVRAIIDPTTAEVEERG